MRGTQDCMEQTGRIIEDGSDSKGGIRHDGNETKGGISNRSTDQKNSYHVEVNTHRGEMRFTDTTGFIRASRDGIETSGGIRDNDTQGGIHSGFGDGIHCQGTSDC